MTISPVCEPSSESRSTSSLAAFASASVNEGWGTCASIMAGNSSLAPNRSRPASAMRTMASGVFRPDLANSIGAIFGIRTFETNLVPQRPADGGKLGRVCRAVLAFADQSQLRTERLLDGGLISSHKQSAPLNRKSSLAPQAECPDTTRAGTAARTHPRRVPWQWASLLRESAEAAFG